MSVRRRTGNARRWPDEAGLTLLELIVSCAILTILATMAIPIARYTAQRERENELKRDLLMMREAIDRYKDMADHGQIRVDALTGGYPPDLQTLVKGVQLTSNPGLTGTIGAIGSSGTGIAGAPSITSGSSASAGGSGGTGSAGSSGGGSKIIRFLRAIPVDPMTHNTDWGLRSTEDDPDAKTWGGQNIFDVYSKSAGTAMNGKKYSEW